MTGLARADLLPPRSRGGRLVCSTLLLPAVVRARCGELPAAHGRRFCHPRFPLRLRRVAAAAAHALPHVRQAAHGCARRGAQRGAHHARHRPVTAGTSCARSLPASCSARGSRSMRHATIIVLPDGIGHGRSSKPSDGLHARFPHYAYNDMVQAHYLLLDAGPEGQSCAARHGHLHGRHAHLAVGRAASAVHGRAHAARQPA